MMFNYNEFLNYTLPDDWCTEEDMDSLILYNPNGNGAIIVSFFNALNVKESLDEQISILAKRFIDKNKINLRSALILFNRDEKTILYGSGRTADRWYIKLWVVAKWPKIVFATYQSERKSAEVTVCDAIIDSFQIKY